MSDHLERFTKRLENESGFWAGTLARHRQLLGLTETQQADLLHTDHDGLLRLARCWLPRPDHHAEDLSRVAQHAGADLDALSCILDAVK